MTFFIRGNRKKSPGTRSGEREGEEGRHFQIRFTIPDVRFRDWLFQCYSAASGPHISLHCVSFRDIKRVCECSRTPCSLCFSGPSKFDPSKVALWTRSMFGRKVGHFSNEKITRPTASRSSHVPYGSLSELWQQPFPPEFSLLENRTLCSRGRSDFAVVTTENNTIRTLTAAKKMSLL